MDIDKKTSVGIVAAIIIILFLVWQFGPMLRPQSIFALAEKVPIQIGYNESGEYWIISSVVNELEQFKMVLEADSTENLDNDENVVAQSEVGILLNPLAPYSKTNLTPYDIKYPLGPRPPTMERLPSYVLNSGGWLTTAVYEVSVWKDGEEITKQTVEMDYQKQHIIYLETPDGTVTINNLGMLAQGVEVPSGELVTIEDPWLERHIFWKTDVMQWMDEWSVWVFDNNLSPPTSYANMWEKSVARGWLPEDVMLTHIESVEYIDDMDYVQLNYSGIAFAGFISIYIPDELADTITVQLYAPEPEIVSISPDPLPSVPEGQSCVFYVEVINKGTRGTVDISVSSDNYGFTPLTQTSVTMEEQEKFVFKFSAYALNVLASKETVSDVFVQARGGTDTYELEGYIENVEGYTPPAVDPDGGNGDNGGNGEFPWVWIIVAIIIILIIAAVIYFYIKYYIQSSLLDNLRR